MRRLDAAFSRRGLTRHRSYVNHRRSNRLSERDETVYWNAVSSHRFRQAEPTTSKSMKLSIGGRCQATANESGVKPPQSKITHGCNLQTDACRSHGLCAPANRLHPTISLAINLIIGVSIHPGVLQGATSVGEFGCGGHSAIQHK